MRVAWLTDIHLNFLTPEEVEAFARSVAAVHPDVVVISGDIGEAHDVCAHLERLAGLIRRPIYFVLGNHDYYRGSVAAVRAEAAELARRATGLTYLSSSEVVPLTTKTALVGHDGWGDGGFGNAESSPITLNDFLLIAEMRTQSRKDRLRAMRWFGEAAAEHLRRVLPAALQEHENVLAVTHVPPFREAAWHEGRVSDDDWLPYFACRATGEAMVEVMAAHPHARLTVLCGHTHGGTCTVLPNLTVITGAAEYGRPRVAGVIEVE